MVLMDSMVDATKKLGAGIGRCVDEFDCSIFTIFRDYGQVDA